MREFKAVVIIAICVWMHSISCFAQEIATPPFVSPYYYGPNAFPIPEILVNTSDKLRIGVAYDYFKGKTSHTHDIMLKTNVPLWTERANLSIWWPAVEVYSDNGKKGSMSGDVYISIDMQLLKDNKRKPSWTLRAALKTASGGGYDIGRYYDCPGYFFDTYFGKLLKIGQVQLQMCAGGGFLCWQTDNGRQNDAYQYGVLVGIRIGNFKISESVAGYNGWQSNSKSNGHLVHDKPVSVKTRLVYNLRNVEINAQFQQGINDYPFSQFQLGVNYLFDILNKRKCN